MIVSRPKSMPEDSILAGMKPSALGNVGRSLSNQLAEVDKLFTSDLSRRARHADGCINVAGVSKTGAPADEFAMANRICALVPTTAMAAITLPVRSEDWIADATAADLTFLIFDGAADPANLRHFAASVSGSSYWVLVVGG